MCYCDNGYSPISAGTGSGGGSGGGTITQIQTLSPAILPVFNGNGPIVQLKINEAALSSSKLKVTVTAGENISANKFCFIDSTDGNAVIASDTTLLRDMYYDNLTINAGATLYPNGFRIFARTSVVNNGIIDRSGLNASGTSATTALAAGTLAAGAAGGAGGTAAGSAGGASATSLGGAGGAGGLGSGGAGGLGGTNTLNTAAAGGVETFQNVDRSREGKNIAGTSITGGSGGGGAGGDGVAGGAGGGGGGLIVIMTPLLTGTGQIKAVGGAGFTPITGGNKGGGGGGGGGIINLISENNVAATSLVMNVSGGAGASGVGTGVTGQNGTIGRIYYVRV